MTSISKPKPHGISGLAPDGWYTISQAASRVGRSEVTLRRWHRTGRYPATNQMRVGQLNVWVYSDQDIANMRNVAKNIKAGRPFKTPIQDGGDNSTN